MFKYITKLFSAKKAITKSEKLELIQEGNIVKFKIRDKQNAWYATFNMSTGKNITNVRYNIGKMLKEVNPIKIDISNFITALNGVI